MYWLIENCIEALRQQRGWSCTVYLDTSMPLNFLFSSEKPMSQYLEERFLDQFGQDDSRINTRQSFQTLFNCFVHFVSFDLCRNLGLPT